MEFNDFIYYSEIVKFLNQEIGLHQTVPVTQRNRAQLSASIRQFQVSNNNSSSDSHCPWKRTGVVGARSGNNCTSPPLDENSPNAPTIHRERERERERGPVREEAQRPLARSRCGPLLDA